MRNLTPKQKLGAWVFAGFIIFLVLLWLFPELRDAISSWEMQPRGPFGPHVNR